MFGCWVAGLLGCFYEGIIQLSGQATQHLSNLATSGKPQLERDAPFVTCCRYDGFERNQRSEEGDKTVRTQSIRGGEVAIEYTAKALSGWGGLALFYEFGSKVGFFDEMEKVLPNKKVSPNQISSGDIVKTLFATVLCGGNRFSHVERVRADEVIRTVMGVERVGGADTVRRLFDGYMQSECEDIYLALQQQMSAMLGGRKKEDILDLDSTILERYGSQEGVSKGYHTARAGQTSHHPLLGMLAGSKHIVHSWLRAGGASTLRGPAQFMEELVTRLPDQFKISVVRADSGFHTEEFLETVESHGLDYIVAARMRQPMQRLAARQPASKWTRLDDEHEIAEVLEQQPNWKRPRRLLIIRRAIKHNGQLFSTISYEYRALVTSLTLDPASCWKLYDQRGDCENTIKEFKNDFGARGFCMSSFHATEMVFRLLTVLFNLLSEFKHQVLKDSSVTLATVRMKIFVLGAMLGRRARTVVLRLGLTKRWKETFDTLLDRASSLSGPTAAHFIQTTATPLP